jgi:UDP-hydrolysing UDP-N-acetyl-D-glucosamine 2-epimerase
MRKKNQKRKIAVVLVDRANYGRLKPVMVSIKNHEMLELVTICSGTMVLNRFGRPLNIVKSDGFEIDAEIYIELEGSTPTTMAKSLGFGIVEFSSEFARLKPDIILVIGDRYEALAAALAASYMNICLAHIQGGEISGSIDESARHCISKLAQFHFPSTRRSAEFLKKMGEKSDSVFMFGCPSGDIAKKLDKTIEPNIFANGIGAEIDINKPYILVVFHPITTSYGSDTEAVFEILHACEKLNLQVVWLWPNIDAGSDHFSAVLRRYREHKQPNWLRMIKNFSPDDYQRVLANAMCAVGNSSSFIRDSSFFGTPVVIVGERQQYREFAANVIKSKCTMDDIYSAVKYQINIKRYSESDLYGVGDASDRIANTLATLEPYIQKTLSYVLEND